MHSILFCITIHKIRDRTLISKLTAFKEDEAAVFPITVLADAESRGRWVDLLWFWILPT